MRIRPIVVLVTLIALAVSAQHLDAAEVTIDPPNSECSLVLSGPIVSGDAEKLRSAMSGYFEQYWRALNGRAPSVAGRRGPNEVLLCLSSRGGSLEEAFDLATLVFENSWATRVQQNDSCLSACAIIFMAGNRKWRSGRPPIKDRQLSITATLGFHAPKPPSFEGKGDTVEAYDAALDHIGKSLLSIANLGFGYWSAPMIKPTLINQLAMTSHTRFFVIDTIGKAAENEIDIVGISDVTPIAASIKARADAAFNICYNAVAAKFTLDHADVRLRAGIEFISHDANSDGHISISVRFEQSSRLMNCNLTFFSYLENVRIEFGSQDIDLDVPLWYALAPSASLAGREGPIWKTAASLGVCSHALRLNSAHEASDYCAYPEIVKLEVEWRLLRSGRLAGKRLGGLRSATVRLAPDYTVQAESQWRDSMAKCRADFVCLWNGYNHWLGWVSR